MSYIQRQAVAPRPRLAPIREAMRAGQALRDKAIRAWASDNKVGTKQNSADFGNWRTRLGAYGCAPIASDKGSCRRRRNGEKPFRQQRRELAALRSKSMFK